MIPVNEVNGIRYIDETAYYRTTKTGKTNGDVFDAIFEAEAAIYAIPESNGVQADYTHNASSARSSASTAEMEDMFKEAANQYGIDVDLLKAVAKAESGFNASAVSCAGAIGVMQLMPGTASSLGVADPYNAKDNIMGGAKYLSQLLNKYNGDVSLALAAYNAGSGNVDKYGGIPPFKETQNYVSRVLGDWGNEGYNASANTVYAVAAKDSSVVYSVHAVPETSI